MYLKRLKHLTVVNLKHNPVSQGPNAGLYYEKVIENVPSIVIFDDEIVPNDKADFVLQKKLETKNMWQESLTKKTNVISTSSDPILSRFLKFGVKKETVRMVQASANEVVDALFRSESTTEQIMVNNIKSKNKEQKAKQSYE